MNNVNFENLIYKKEDLFCLNDIANKLIGSSNVKEYMMKIKNKKFMEGNYYIDKNSMLEILKKSKSVKAHQYREYILSNEQKIEEIIVDEKITCIYKDNNKHKTSKEEMKDKIDKRQFVDFGLNEIIFSDSKILFFEFNDVVYFKAKDICNLLGYLNTNDAITKHIDKEDILTFDKSIGDWNGGRESRPLLRDVNTLKKIKLEIEKRTNNFIEPKTVFINESGLYSLILSSKLPQAKAFKNWVTSEVLVSIRKTGSYNKLHNAPKYDEHKLKELEDQSCLYIIHVRDSLYKFGMTFHSYKRMNEHKNNLDYNEIIKIYPMPNSDLVRKVENKIKKYTSNLKIRRFLDEGVEFFETNEIYTLERVLKEISIMVEDDIEIFEKKENNNKLDTLAYIEMKKIEQYEKEILLAEEKTKQLNIEKEIKISEEKTKQAEQKTKQLQIELEILKIKPNQNKIEVKKIQINKNICPKTKKCMDCPTMITEKSTRCTPCVNKLRLKEAIINSKRPSYTQLKSDMDSLGSYIKVSKKYNVSDHTIRNWIKTYENKII